MARLFLLRIIISASLLHCASPSPTKNRLRIINPASHQPPASSLAMAGKHKHDTSSSPLVFFEVSKPVDDPHSTPCSALILEHSFANTYSLPPAVANYTPPSLCGKTWHKVVLKWSGTCKGRQFDRIAAVWFSGVEFLRTCTAEPTQGGIYWEVKKDVTRYSSLLKDPQLVVLELGNVVDSTYTGIFHINLTLEFFNTHSHKSNTHPHKSHHHPSQGPADLVLPISLPSPLSQGYWFQLGSENETASRSFQVPSNVYRAVLEIYVSFHGDDEFWYTNPPNEYIEANNMTDYPGNGPFREVQAFLDGTLVGAVWPFPVVFTGGINPLYWRPAAAIGAYNLPTYDVELTPFVGLLVDGNNHTISMKVKNAIGNWPIDANLHLWLDPQTTQTRGGILKYDAHASSELSSDFEGLDGTFHTTAQRSISYSGYVETAWGKIIVTSSRYFTFDNVLVFQNDSDVQIVTQATESKGEVLAKTASEVVFSQEASSSFPLYLYCLQYSGPNSSYIQDCNFTHSFDEQMSIVSIFGSTFSSLQNSQEAQGGITIVKSTVTAGIGALQQEYDFESSQGCYARSLSTKNYTILYDSSDLACNTIS